ncbi:glycosyltransferase family 2 protein [Pseudoalteromonas xiamenensis]|uniref:Glycosyltransferase family 2 protein n=1 Tax=Pseudoalteromonas xiamenensis TaxID=882626 RepID=A0A975DJ83_9GAMM|nr:glycosyltransferase family 2 protein [Pseudoalteromonas xiamenensis]QTH72544.1 glycosyltransferase family 2 protein [Pseudoalteromonas xiamenensis]
MVRYLICVVSHGHARYILDNKELAELSEFDNVDIVVRDNLGELSLKEYCAQNGFAYLHSPLPLGFGDNNNAVFDYGVRELGFTDQDWFLMINPDVLIEKEQFKALIVELNEGRRDFYTINLYKDHGFTIPENSVRYFAGFLSLFNPILLRPINSIYDKSVLEDNSYVEWASGAFLCIKFGVFGRVGGFDSRYFMYFEDVDLCFRLKEQGVYLTYLKNIKAIHCGQYKNRSLFSKHFRWYLSSLFRFLFVRRRFI